MSTLKNNITEDMKNAMRSKDTLRLGTIRMLLAAIKQKEVDERLEPTDAVVIAIIEKSIKQRKDSIAQFASAGRQDLVEQEQAELTILQAYMPTQMSIEEITLVVAQVKLEIDANTIQDIGKLMGALKLKLAGKADMTQVSAAVKLALL
ncbi:MAG: hypothetical protein RL344_461 [Pseudomonadota bacterium]|jgi:uncharacterized protein YqeY